MPVCYRSNYGNAPVYVPKIKPISGPITSADECLALIALAAERGEKCPTNSVLADQLGYLTEKSAGKLIRKLVESGDISIRTVSPSWRVVTINATGRQTKAPTGRRGGKPL